MNLKYGKENKYNLGDSFYNKRFRGRAVIAYDTMELLIVGSNPTWGELFLSLWTSSFAILTLIFHFFDSKSYSLNGKWGTIGVSLKYLVKQEFVDQ